MEKQNRTRNIQKIFRVTAEEKRLIQEKMRLVGMTNMREYMRCMLTKGYIVTVDYTELKNLAAEIRQKQAECWDLMRQLFKEAMKLKSHKIFRGAGC